MKDSLSFHNPMIFTGLKDLTPNTTPNLDDGPFFIQCMNRIQGTKPYGRQWNIILDVLVAIIKY